MQNKDKPVWEIFGVSESEFRVIISNIVDKALRDPESELGRILKGFIQEQRQSGDC